MMGTITFAKIVGAIAIVGTLGAGGFKAIDLIWNDGEFKGTVLSELKSIPRIEKNIETMRKDFKEEFRDVREDFKEMQRDIKEVLKRLPK